MRGSASDIVFFSPPAHSSHRIPFHHLAHLFPFLPYALRHRVQPHTHFGSSRPSHTNVTSVGENRQPSKQSTRHRHALPNVQPSRDREFHIDQVKGAGEAERGTHVAEYCQIVQRIATTILCCRVHGRSSLSPLVHFHPFLKSLYKTRMAVSGGQSASAVKERTIGCISPARVISARQDRRIQ